MKKDHSRFTFFNLGSSTIKNIITSLVGLAATPIIIRAVGDADFGLFKTLITFYGQFSILEFGLYATVLSLFIKEIDGTDESKAGVLNWGIKKTRFSAMLSLVVSAAGSYFVFHRFANDINRQDLFISLVTAQLFFIFLPFLPYKAYLESHHKSYVVSWLQLLSSLTTTGTSVLLVSYYPGVSSLMIATFLGMLTANVFMRRHLPEGLLKLKTIVINPRASHMQFSFFMNEVNGKLCLMIDELTISFMMGPKFVVPFFISQRLPQIIQLQLLNIGNSSWSTLGMIFNSKDMLLFNRRLIELTKITAVFGSCTLVVIAIYNKNFIDLWISKNEYAGSWFTIVICLNSFILPILTIWGWSFNYSQLVKKLTPITTAQTLINVAGSIFFTTKYGILGPVLGTVISYFTVPVIFISLAMKKHYEISLLRLHLSWFLPLLLAALFYVTAIQLPWIYETTGWPTLILKMALSGMFILGLSILLFFSRDEKIQHLERVKKLFKKKV